MYDCLAIVSKVILKEQLAKAVANSSMLTLGVASEREFLFLDML